MALIGSAPFDERKGRDANPVATSDIGIGIG
jgi:hypothetical protein